jgi:hypothetical protein
LNLGLSISMIPLLSSSEIPSKDTSTKITFQNLGSLTTSDYPHGGRATPNST